MRIHIKKKPHSFEITEFELGALVVGKTIDVPARLATLLIVGGCAEPVAERADDSDSKRRPIKER